MNWASMSSLDALWRSPTFPMWLTLAAAAFFSVIVLFTLIRAEKSVANGALTVITLLAIGVAVAATIRGFGPGSGGTDEARAVEPAGVTLALPALSCVDDLAGDAVMAACEKTLFGSAEATAAAVSYVASRITRLTRYGDVAAASKIMTPDMMALRRSVERDRYGLVAQVLSVRDHCRSSDCAVYASLTDHSQIAANMDEKAYDATVARYAPGWTAAPPNAAAWNAPPPANVSALPPSVPTGKPTNADFPTSASIPPVNIMTPEPGPRQASLPAVANAPAAPPRQPAAVAAPGANAPGAIVAAAKKPAAVTPSNTPPKIRPPVQAPGAPVRVAPAAPAADN